MKLRSIEKKNKENFFVLNFCFLFFLLLLLILNPYNILPKYLCVSVGFCVDCIWNQNDQIAHQITKTFISFIHALEFHLMLFASIRNMMNDPLNSCKNPIKMNPLSSFFSAFLYWIQWVQMILEIFCRCS